jgi:hypothetical protein
MASIWREEVRRIVRGFHADDFILSEVYRQAVDLAQKHPNNNTVNDTVRRVLQEIRDESEIEFLGQGRYRRLALDRGPYLEEIHDGNSAAPGTPEVTGEPDTVPLENRSADSTTIPAREAAEAIQREQHLVTSYTDHLTKQGHVVKRWRIAIGGGANLYTDLYDETTKTLYEAKGRASREHIRLAIGQLLDYRRYLEVEAIAVLLPTMPAGDMIDLRDELKIGCIVPSGETFLQAKL